MATYTTIDNPELYFQTKIYSGTGSSLALTLDGDTDMQPDWVWFKRRDGSANHHAYDSVRGVTAALVPNDTDVETTGSLEATNYFSSFDSDGFTLAGGNYNNSNKSGQTYVAWCWKESADAGFDMVTYTGNQTARTISHSLSAVPHWMVIKNRGSTYSWQVYHGANTSAPETEIMYLNQDAATSDSNVEWNDTAPTSSVFTVGTDVGVNQSSQSHIAYLFSGKQGYSKFGSYTGNANNDGAFIYLGFKPAFFMVKKTDATDDWRMFDNKRPGINVIDDELKANENGVEGTGDKMDFLSNGVKFRISTSVNTSNTFVYMAFAEAPFVNSNGVPANAR